MAFTKTWVNDSHSHTSLDINGFAAPINLEQDNDIIQKKQGGGVLL